MVRAQSTVHVWNTPGLCTYRQRRWCIYAMCGAGGGVVPKPCPTLGTPWTIACQAPPSMKFSKQEYWPAVPFPSPGGFPDPGVKAGPAALQPDSLPAFSPQPSPSPTLYHKGSCISLWMLCTCSFICPWPWSVHTVRPSGPESTWDHLGRKFWSPGFRSQV